MSKFVIGFVLAIVAAAGFYVLPWKIGDWGTVVTRPASTIMVVGEARTKVGSQVASFSVGINVVNDSKQAAIDEVNKKISEVITAVKAFGVEEVDIKTQSLSVNQNEESYYDNGTQKYRPGQWRVGNTIEVVLRNVDQANAFADLLAKTGANNVYGPNFSLDDSRDASDQLLADAYDNAYLKAQQLAKAAGKKILKTLSVSEGATVQPGPIYYSDMRGGGGGGGMEPGTQPISKQVTVVFEVF